MTRKCPVARWSQVLEWMTTFSLVVIPVATIVTLSIIPITPEVLGLKWDNLAVSPAVTRTQMYTATALNLIPMAILLLTLNTMRRLFGRYRQGQILTNDCATLIRRIGQGFLALSLAPLVLRPVSSVLLTMGNPPEARSISFGVSSEMVFFALAGGLIMVIGWAMGEAADLASENRAFI